MDAPNGPPPVVPLGNPYPQVRFEVIGDACRLFQQQMGVWIGASILIAVISQIAGFILQMLVGLGIAPLQDESDLRLFMTRLVSPPVILGIIVYAMIVVCLQAGLYRMAVKQVHGEVISIGDLFSITDVFGPLVIVSILVPLVVGIATVFCIIPGLVVAALLMLSIPLVVDQRLDAMSAMRASWDALRSDVVMATLFLFVAGVLTVIVSICCCCVGQLVAGPVEALAISIIYRDFFPPRAGNAPPVL
jgi:hypothetical protein